MLSRGLAIGIGSALLLPILALVPTNPTVALAADEIEGPLPDTDASSTEQGSQSADEQVEITNTRSRVRIAAGGSQKGSGSDGANEADGSPGSMEERSGARAYTGAPPKVPPRRSGH